MGVRVTTSSWHPMIDAYGADGQPSGPLRYSSALTVSPYGGCFRSSVTG